MWHTCAYSGSITNGSTNAQVNAVTDNVFRVGSQNGFVLQEDMMLLMAVYTPTNGTAARFLAPKLAQFGYLQVTPIQSAEKVANGLLVCSWPYRPFTFRNQEEVLAYVDTGGTAATNEDIIAFFSNGVDPIPQGEELTIKFTSTTALVARTWTSLTITLSQTLPEGKYSLIGSELQSTNAIAHRWTFWGQFYRAGFPSTTAYTNIQYPGVKDYRLGLAGQFSNVTLPTVEAFGAGTDNSHTGFIHCIKTA